MRVLFRAEGFRVVQDGWWVYFYGPTPFSIGILGVFSLGVTLLCVPLAIVLVFTFPALSIVPFGLTLLAALAILIPAVRRLSIGADSRQPILIIDTANGLVLDSAGRVHAPLGQCRAVLEFRPFVHGAKRVTLRLPSGYAPEIFRTNPYYGARPEPLMTLSSQCGCPTSRERGFVDMVIDAAAEHRAPRTPPR